jgi:6-phosphofructokinase 2
VPSIITFTMNPAVDLSSSVARVVPAQKLRCAIARRDPGGGGINVARVISRLGGEVTAIYPLGGATGLLLRRLVEDEGVRSITFPVVEETRLSFTVVEEDTGQEYKFLLPGPSLSTSEWQQGLAELTRHAEPSGLLVISGSLPPGAPADLYARAARAAKELGARIVLDSSGPPLAAALEKGVFLVKPNLREMRELTGRALEDEPSRLAACESLVRTGHAEAVALTLGDEGALLVTRQAALRAPALAIRPASTVGAGDSFLGAMVWALACGRGLEEAFRYGVAAGSAALISSGTELCRRDDVERLLPEVATAHAP